MEVGTSAPLSISQPGKSPRLSGFFRNTDGQGKNLGIQLPELAMEWRTQCWTPALTTRMEDQGVGLTLTKRLENQVPGLGTGWATWCQSQLSL